jgi:hypothetical protein
MEIKAMDIVLFLLFTGSTIVIGHKFYMSWFKPLDFLKNESMSVKKWWPSSDYFKAYYASPQWLWTTRVSTTIFISIIIFLICRAFLSFINLSP